MKKIDLIAMKTQALDDNQGEIKEDDSEPSSPEIEM